MDMMVRNRVKELLAIKERQELRTIPLNKFAKEAKIPLSVAYTLAKNDVTRFDNKTIVALCQYFKCDIGDLFTLQEIRQENGLQTRV